MIGEHEHILFMSVASSRFPILLCNRRVCGGFLFDMAMAQLTLTQHKTVALASIRMDASTSQQTDQQYSTYAHGMMRSEAPRTMSNETNIDFYISAAMSCTKADVFCRVIIFVAAYQLIYDLDVCFISHFFSITIFKYKESQKSIYLTQLILVC